MNSENQPLLATNGDLALDRASPDALAEQVRLVGGHPIVRALLDAFEGGVMVLNEYRQIVAANLRDLVARPEELVPKVLALRPGEVVGCDHAREAPGGCGAAEACRGCSVLKTVVGCQQSLRPTEGECLLTAGNGALRPLELRLRATPLEIEGQRFTVVAVRDISDEKRRRALEQTFFHDISNSVMSLSLWSQRLLKVPPDQFAPTAERVVALVGRVGGEIRNQRLLLHAEEGTLHLEPTEVRTLATLRELVESFVEHPAANERVLEIDPESVDVALLTDASLLVRVLANMILNALEASPKGGTVRVGCSGRERNGRGEWACCFHVHNATVMPPSVAMNVFLRSFSTKAKRGRGLGTYSMKLLGQKYLRGEVSFSTRAGEGTTFRLKMPGKLRVES